MANGLLIVGVVLILVLLGGLIGLAVWNNTSSSASPVSSSASPVSSTSSTPSSTPTPTSTPTTGPKPANPFTLTSQPLVNALAYPTYCLDITGGTKDSLYPLQVFTCKPSGSNGNELWTYNPTDKSIKSDWSGLCLDVYGGSKGPGVNVGLYTCTGSPQQQWVYNTTTAQLSPQNDPTVCLDLQDGVSTSGPPTVTGTCDTSRVNQRWYPV